MNDPMARQTDRKADAGSLFDPSWRDAVPLRQAQGRQAPPSSRPIAQTSIDANATVDRGRDYDCILRWLKPRNVDGGTHAEWCIEFGRETSTSGRFTELAAAELIAGIPGETRAAPGRRAGQVYRLSVRGIAALGAGPAAILNAVRAAKQKRRKAS